MHHPVLFLHLGLQEGETWGQEAPFLSIHWVVLTVMQFGHHWVIGGFFHMKIGWGWGQFVSFVMEVSYHHDVLVLPLSLATADTPGNTPCCS